MKRAVVVQAGQRISTRHLRHRLEFRRPCPVQPTRNPHDDHAEEHDEAEAERKRERHRLLGRIAVPGQRCLVGAGALLSSRCFAGHNALHAGERGLAKGLVQSLDQAIVVRVYGLDDPVVDVIVGAVGGSETGHRRLCGGRPGQRRDVIQVRHERAFRRTAGSEHGDGRRQSKLAHQRLLETDPIPSVLKEGAQRASCIGSTGAPGDTLLGQQRETGQHTEHHEQTGATRRHDPALRPPAMPTHTGLRCIDIRKASRSGAVRGEPHSAHRPLEPGP